MKQRDNISGFEAMHLAQEDESLEFQSKSGNWCGVWKTFNEWWKGSIENQPLHEKDWSIRKRETNLDKAVKELFSVALFSTDNVEKILSKYIKN